MTKKQGFLLFFAFVFIFSACRKDVLLTDSSAKLEFSDGAIVFDTVFTTIGSVTRAFKIYNRNNRKIEISSIQLAGGNSSQYRINVDGTPLITTENIEIEANDSMFVFVEVTVDPQNSNSPMIVTDSVVFITNGNIQDVDLIAWGQDAHYFYPNYFVEGLPPFSIISNTDQNITWNNDKPYVIYGYAVVDSASSLTINEGVRVHLHKNGGLWVYKGGTLKVKGTKANPVTFQGDRLEQDYKDIPGQWDRIWINDGSLNNEIDYAIIKNGNIGIQAEVLPPIAYPRKLKITNTVIKNMSGMGLFTRFFDIDANNLLVNNCGTYTLALTYGGTYSFKHCTFANYWREDNRKTTSVLINNFDGTNSYSLDNLYFGNCILYGDKENEILFEQGGSEPFNYLFEYSLLRTTNATSDASHYMGVFVNADPGFVDPSKEDYKLKSDAFSRDKGKISIAQDVPLDLEGNSRISTPDLGVYEVQ